MSQSVKIRWSHFVAWHFMAALLVVFAASNLLGAPPWLMRQDELLLINAFSGAYFLSIIFPSISYLSTGKPRLWISAILLILIFLATYLVLEEMGVVAHDRTWWRTGRVMLLASLILLPLFKVGANNQKIVLFLLAVTVVGWGASYTGYYPLFEHQESRAQKTFYKNSVYYNLEVRPHWRPFNGFNVEGGGLELLGDKYFLATSDGLLYLFGFDNDGEIDAVKLTTRVPYNPKKFAEDAPDGASIRRFRVGGVAARQVQDGLFEIYLSHHYWYSEKECVVVRVSRTVASTDTLLIESEQLDWETVFESKPCLTLYDGEKVFFGGLQIGGQMVFRDDGSLLLTLGDHEFDGVFADRILSQDLEADYGKTVLIDLESKRSRYFTIGHRNQQGLAKLNNGEIWSLEHGPQGGDELNRLIDGENYGWPLVTYGTDYGHFDWPLTEVQGRHDGYAAPAFVWAPSIATTTLLQVRQPLFRWWQGDLLVGTLKSRTLHRLRLDGERIILDEPVELGYSIRDMVEGPDGMIVVWSDEGSVLTIRPVLDQAVGSENPELLFASRCSGCHKIGDGTQHGIGPDLAGVAGRSIGRAVGYKYSDSLAERTGSWSREQLDIFLSDPQEFAPGNAMRAAPTTSSDERAALIKYLESR